MEQGSDLLYFISVNIDVQGTNDAIRHTYEEEKTVEREYKSQNAEYQGGDLVQ